MIKVNAVLLCQQARKLFKKTLIGGFSCVNTRLAFDSQILLPKEKENLKLIYKFKINGKKQNKRFVTKNLKKDENNQYGNAMTKALPYVSFKKLEKIPTLREFNITLNNISYECKIHHLFLVDINFYEMNEKTLLFNQLYTPLFEKQKLTKPYENFVLQPLSVMSRNKVKDIITKDIIKT